jgi:hypothetical protein
MRYVLTSPRTEDMLAYFRRLDAKPRVYPSDPGDLGLVVLHLVGGSVIAEALPSLQHFKEVCGGGVPLGRLYFKVPRATIEEMSDKDISFKWV